MTTHPYRRGSTGIDKDRSAPPGPPIDHIWLVRPRRADRGFIVAIGLTSTAAHDLAERIRQLVQPDRDITPTAQSDKEGQPWPNQSECNQCPSPASSAVGPWSVRVDRGRVDDVPVKSTGISNCWASTPSASSCALDRSSRAGAGMSQSSCQTGPGPSWRNTRMASRPSMFSGGAR
jgi:hypothetical protein